MAICCDGLDKGKFGTLKCLDYDLEPEEQWELEEAAERREEEARMCCWAFRDKDDY